MVSGAMSATQPLRRPAGRGSRAEHGQWREAPRQGVRGAARLRGQGAGTVVGGPVAVAAPECLQGLHLAVERAIIEAVLPHGHALLGRHVC